MHRYSRQHMHSSSLSLGRAKYPSEEYSYKVVTALMENYQNSSVRWNWKDTQQIDRYFTFDDRSGETYTLWVAETFFGDMSGRFGNRASRGDSGYGPTDTIKVFQQSLYGVSTRTMLLNFYIGCIPSTEPFSSSFFFGLAPGPTSTNKGLTAGINTSL